MKNGFTFIEMVVVITIAVLILGIGYFNYRSNERKESVLLDARRLTSVLKQAQNLALSGQEFSGSQPLGYGVYLSTTNTYTFFATNENYLYNTGRGEEIFNYSLSRFVIFNPFSVQHQVFALPSANLYVNNLACSTNQELILRDNRTAEQKKVKINCQSGQIEVSD